MKLTTVGALSLCLLAMSAYAEDTSAPAPMRGPMAFADYDVNGDGAISEQEFNEARAKRMAARAEEGRPMRGMANAPSFADFDANGDGKLSPEELTKGQQAQMQKRPGMTPGMGSGQGMGMKGGQGQGMMQSDDCPRPPKFEDLDTDGNGCISPDEFKAHQQQCMPMMMQQKMQKDAK
ncbi:EF-hand domain-containing protein [Sinimarinibacterium sp. CAU 1509]|uniref:EF-hand domain-containing protein n=1 Tax=Sinimarinibacterium sp. CAU 1509 TaxID=2562283 RepID=UPI0010ABC352|nr:EF-hand domain-containing protein [Sinimarinibacterium sp. CAU 1509]TJY59910.1 EF-hand domain-containing protein [Sinimarinibacterium sp. CAU 1509]